MRFQFKRVGLTLLTFAIVGTIVIRCGKDAYVVVQPTKMVAQNGPQAPVELPPKIIVKDLRPGSFASFSVYNDFNNPPENREFKNAHLKECAYYTQVNGAGVNPMLSLRFEDDKFPKDQSTAGMTLRFHGLDLKKDTDRITGDGKVVYEKAFEQYQTYGFNKIATSLGGEDKDAERPKSFFQTYQFDAPYAHSFSTCGLVYMVHNFEPGQEWITVRFICDKMTTPSFQTKKVTGEFQCPLVRKSNLKTIEPGYLPVSVISEPADGRGGKVISIPAGISCGFGDKNCLHYFPVGSKLTFHALPAKGYHSVWSGDGGKDHARTIELAKLESSQSVLGQFDPDTVNLFIHAITLSAKGGKVIAVVPSTGKRLECDNSCTFAVPYGDQVEVTPMANEPDWEIQQGDGRLTETKTFSMHKDESVSAFFLKKATFIVEAILEGDEKKVGKLFAPGTEIAVDFPGKKTYKISPTTKGVALKTELANGFSISMWEQDLPPNKSYVGFNVPIGQIEEGAQYRVKVTVRKTTRHFKLTASSQSTQPPQINISWFAYESEFHYKNNGYPIASGDCKLDEKNTKGVCGDKELPTGSYIKIYSSAGNSRSHLLEPLPKPFTLTKDVSLDIWAYGVMK